jgi:hypothetical protein
MPFDSKTGSDAGRKHGKKGAIARWGERDPASVRTQYLPLKVSLDELAMITARAEAFGLSRVELVVRAVRDWQGIT